MQRGRRCSLCGALCGGDYEESRGPLAADAFAALRLEQHFARVHPGQAVASEAAASRPLTVRAFEKDAGFATRRQGYGLTMQQGSAALERLGIAGAVQDSC